MDSRKIFSNWHILPKVYYKTTDDEFAIFKTKDNLQIKIRVKSTDLMALVNVWIRNEYEIDDFSIKDNDTVIDIGGHIGLFSLLVSQKSRHTSIYSFEPIEDNFNLLKTNLELNSIENVHPFNLAVSNSLAAVENGARQIEGCINGLGERAGNAALEEVIMGLEVRKDHFNVETKVNTSEIGPTSRLVSNLFGFPMQANKAIVGQNAFRHSSGIHQDAFLKDRSTFEIMEPETV